MQSSDLDRLQFLINDQVLELGAGSSPLFVYSRAALVQAANEAKKFKMPFGETIRYAMKANPHPEIIKILYKEGIQIDASSGPEVDLALRAGVKPEHIMLTTQQLPDNLKQLTDKGVIFNASSLHQLESYCKQSPGSKVSVRINPGLGSGTNRRVTTGGVLAAFGIWHDYIPQIKQLAEQHSVEIAQVHTHIGSGTDPDEWLAITHLTLDFMKEFPQATKMSVGGGFKVGRMSTEHSADLSKISDKISELIKDYADQSGRQLQIEIEPGTFLVARAGTLITTVVDVKDTGTDGYRFVVVNSGMNDILRPSLYGAQHPLVVVPKDGQTGPLDSFIVSGHCCESGDILTVASGDSEVVEPRLLQTPKIGDYLCIEAVGAYCASMRATAYNSFLPAGELFID